MYLCIVETGISFVMMIVFVGYIFYGNMMLVYELLFLDEGGVLRRS
jgi:hypothetical protein